MRLKKEFTRLTHKQRLYELPVPMIGLTGGIASGKTTVGKAFLARGLPVINADLLVKDVYTLPETLAHISLKYPQAVEKGLINFPLLRQLVFSDPKVKQDIESLIYAKLPQAFMTAYHKLSNPEVVVYDVPLLFEKKMEALFDLNVLVYAPRKIQLSRLILRDGHAEALAEKILDQQMDIEEKRLKAEFVIENSQTEAELTEEIEHFLRQCFES